MTSPTSPAIHSPSGSLGHKSDASNYVGRFAPSPSGPLHLGSLVCALASYLDAKTHHGKWLVRIEDIDPPREQAGSDQLILDSLQQHGLFWDEEVLYQSSRTTAYLNALSRIQTEGLSYFCTCNRKRLKSLNGRYDGLCRDQIKKPSAAASIRLNSLLALPATQQNIKVQDKLQGQISENFCDTGDVIIHRKDGLFAYQLAVSVDDIKQGITNVVRGNDLLETTPKQVLLMQVLGASAPSYAHIPVLVDDQGRKLSKQNHATPINSDHAFSNLKQACHALRLFPPSSFNDTNSLLNWAINSWDISQLKNQKQICEAETRLV